MRWAGNVQRNGKEYKCIQGLGW